MFAKKKPNKVSNISQEINIHVYLNKQASKLVAAAHADEVSELKRRLELANEELIRTNKLLAEKQGMRFTFDMIWLVVVLSC